MVVISIEAVYNIESFYKAFALKHRYDYTIEMMIDNINQVINGVKGIDANRSRVPMLEKHRQLGYREYPFVRTRGQKFDWYVEYKEEEDDEGNPFIHVYEVLHRSQMHESCKPNTIVLTETQLRNIIAESVRAVMYN